MTQDRRGAARSAVLERFSAGGRLLVARRERWAANRHTEAREGRFIATAYGPPWGGIQGRGTTSTGIDLHSSPHELIVAVDPTVIPYHTLLSIWPNPFGTRRPFAAEDTGAAIRGDRIDFYDWRGRAHQYAWGRRAVQVQVVGRLHIFTLAGMTGALAPGATPHVNGRHAALRPLELGR